MDIKAILEQRDRIIALYASQGLDEAEATKKALAELKVRYGN